MEVESQKNKKYIYIKVLYLDYINRKATMGIVIGKKDKLGKGIGREAIGILKNFVFNSLNLNRLDLEVLEHNIRGYKCYTACGFKEEGRKRKAIFHKGSYKDLIFMSILKEEFLEWSTIL